jgi:uncharacterized membrane protein
MGKKNLFKDDFDIENKDSLNTRIAQNMNDMRAKNSTFADKMSDKIAYAAGTWTFIITFMIIMIVWVTINTFQLFMQPFDPFPFILLNLCLSTIAAFQAPVILMSQRRQDEKDRLRDEMDYRINAKNEVLIEEILKRLDRMEHKCDTLIMEFHMKKET